MGKNKETGTILDFQGEGPTDPKAEAFHTGWREAEHERGISFKAPWEDPFAGFPEHGRRLARALADTDTPVHLRSLDPSMQFQQRFSEAGSDAEKLHADYADLLQCSIKNYTVEIIHTIADDVMLQRLTTHRFLDPEHLAYINRNRIISTVFERDRISESAARCLNAVGQVWVANQADSAMLKRCGVERVKVVPIPFSPDDPLLKLQGRTRQPGPVRFYHIGKWEHRKAHHEMMGAFLQAFKPGEAKLYFKTSSKAPDFGDYPSSAEESVKRWIDQDATIAKAWTLEAANQDIFIIKRRIPAKQIRELHRVGDVYLSLSRGEGFDMPAYDSQLAGNLMVYTPSGGPQDFAGSHAIEVPVTGKVPCHPFYRWDGAEYHDWQLEDGVAALRKAKTRTEDGWPQPYEERDAFSARAVGKRMREHIAEMIEDGDGE